MALCILRNSFRFFNLVEYTFLKYVLRTLSVFLLSVIIFPCHLYFNPCVLLNLVKGLQLLLIFLKAPTLYFINSFEAFVCLFVFIDFSPEIDNSLLSTLLRYYS